MAIIVENGDGLPNAQAYIDAAYLQSYAAARGYDLSGYTQSQIEAAIIIAAQDWIDGQHSFSHEKLKADQALAFPRTVFGMPEQIKLANAKAAYLQLKGALLVDTTAINASGIVESESKSVGPLSKSVTYRAGSYQLYGRVLPVDLTNLLLPYQGGGSMMGVVCRR